MRETSEVKAAGPRRELYQVYGAMFCSAPQTIPDEVTSNDRQNGRTDGRKDGARDARHDKWLCTYTYIQRKENEFLHYKRFERNFLPEKMESDTRSVAGRFRELLLRTAAERTVNDDGPASVAATNFIAMSRES